MALKRVWTPTGSFSGGSTKRLLVIHTMEGFTGANGAKDCAIYFQGDVGASSQVCVDNNRGTIWECVSRANGSWTQCNFNSQSISCEQSGFASWSRQYWLDYRSNQLHNIADWLAEESKATGIPLVDLSASSAQGNSWGVCYHSELGSSGCGHSDPGAGFPLDIVLQWARGEGETPPQKENDVTAATAYFHGQKYRACIGVDNRLYFHEPGWPDNRWDMVDEKSNARSGLSYVIDDDKESKSHGERTMTYTNHVGVVCEYVLPPDPPSGTPFKWNDLGANAR